MHGITLFPFSLLFFSLWGEARKNFFPLPGRERLHPTTNHPPDLIDFPNDKSELLQTDPFLVTNHPPEDAKLFELEIQPLQRFVFSARREVYGFQAKFDAIQRQIVYSLAEGESLAFRK